MCCRATAHTCRAPVVLPFSTSIPNTLIFVETMDDSFNGKISSEYKITTDMPVHTVANTLLTHREQYNRHFQTGQRHESTHQAAMIAA